MGVRARDVSKMHNLSCTILYFIIHNTDFDVLYSGAVRSNNVLSQWLLFRCALASSLFVSSLLVARCSLPSLLVARCSLLVGSWAVARCGCCAPRSPHAIEGLDNGTFATHHSPWTTPQSHAIWAPTQQPHSLLATRAAWPRCPRPPSLPALHRKLFSTLALTYCGVTN